MQPEKSCDLVLKGGVTSGLVYGPLLDVLAQTWRFRGLAGASAGAMAAALGAAAEYSRQHGDMGGFQRLTAQCEALPGQLGHLFQASKPFRNLLKAVICLAPGSFQPRYLSAIACFWAPLLRGAAIGIAVLGAIEALLGLPLVWPGLAVAGIFGALISLVIYIAYLIRLTGKHYNFGICSGLAEPGAPPAVTDWLDTALQTVSGAETLLTFGDLKRAGIDLRVVTTNVSQCRVHMLPEFGQPVWFDPQVWRRLFPEPVVAHLRRYQTAPDARLWTLPDADDLPVLVAVRMSLGCPGLMAQVPVYATPEGQHPIWLSDGGLALNFPFDVFDRPNKPHPTFAIDLDSLRASDDPNSRVWSVEDELKSNRQGFDPITGPFGFIWAMVFAMREAQNRTAMRHPDHHGRVYRIGLSRTEGGMNLDMTPEQVRTLMSHGAKAGAHITDIWGKR